MTKVCELGSPFTLPGTLDLTTAHRANEKEKKKGLVSDDSVRSTWVLWMRCKDESLAKNERNGTMKMASDVFSDSIIRFVFFFVVVAWVGSLEISMRRPLDILLRRFICSLLRPAFRFWRRRGTRPRPKKSRNRCVVHLGSLHPPLVLL